MFKFLNEINGDTARLSDTERAVLAAIYNSPTPELAYDVSTGSQNVTYARDYLHKLGAIAISNNAIQLTDIGREMLVANNIIDDSNELTDDGKKMADDINRMKIEFNESLIPFKTLKSLIS